MASLSDLSLRDRIWYHAYSFRRAQTGPLAVLAPQPGEARIALVTSAGLHERNQPPFVHEKGGDWSYRVIRAEVSPALLVCTHPSRSWDRSGVEHDANVAFPLDRLREMAEDGTIGEVAPRHISFQGSITAPGRLVSRTAPEIADILEHDRVDGVILTPV